MTCNRRSFAHRFSAMLALLVVTASVDARADATAAEKAAAEALFDQAKDLMTQRRYADACLKFEQSQAIDPGIGTMLYLAECYERDGRTASAWALFREAASAAQAAGQTERATQGSARAERLEPQLSRLAIVIELENIVDGMVVRRGNDELPRSIWGVPVPVDPGTHRIEVQAPGYRSWSQTVPVGDTAARVSVKVPRLEKLPAASPVPAAAQTQTPPPAATPPQPDPEADSSRGASGGQRLAGFIVGGVGVAGLAVGTGFGIRAISKNNQAEDHCPGGGSLCNDQQGVDLTNEAKDAAMIANIGVIGGAVLTAVGITLLLTAPDDEPATALRLRGGMSQEGGSLSLSGAF